MRLGSHLVSSQWEHNESDERNTKNAFEILILHENFVENKVCYKIITVACPMSFDKELIKWHNVV
jgi:hypothetical protein